MVETTSAMPRRVYPLRVLGMGLGSAAALVVLWEIDATPQAWAFAVFVGFVWPHLAYLLARFSRDPYRAEIRNLLVDSALAAALVPLMQFNLLPSVVLVTLTMVDKITTGVRGLWLRSMPGMLGGGAVVAWAMGGQVALHSSTPVVLACLPMLVLHTLAVSVVSYRAIRQVSRQNRLLDELRRVDPLTGLYGRAHWEQEAKAALERRAREGEPACLLMLDIDGFKQINDRLGHTVGDDVIRAMSHIVRGTVRSSDCAGRYGGDEFAVLLRATDLAQAHEIAQRIRGQAEQHRLRDFAELRFTISIGIAAAQPGHGALRDWIAAADAALYCAKRGGRNQVAAAATAASPPAPTQPHPA